MFQWLIDNKSWVFSGVGVLLISALVSGITWLFRRAQPPGEKHGIDPAQQLSFCQDPSR